MITPDVKIKIKFYVLTAVGFIMMIGTIILGSLMGILGKRFDEVPSYKICIFYGCIVLCGFYVWYYMKYVRKYDSVLTKKKKKK